MPRKCLADDRVDRAAIGPVADIDGDLAHVVDAGAGFGQQRCEVGQRQIGLCRGVLRTAAGAGHGAAVERRAGLAADEQFARAGGDHRTLECDRLAEPLVEAEGANALDRRADRCLGVDLHHQFGQRQSGDDEPRADREYVAQTLADHVIHRLAVGAVDDGGGELGDVGKRAAGGGQCGLDLVHGGMGLRRGVAEAGDGAVRAQRAAAAEEHALPRCEPHWRSRRGCGRWVGTGGHRRGGSGLRACGTVYLSRPSRGRGRQPNLAHEVGEVETR